MVAAAGLDGAGDVVKRITDARVLGVFLVVVVGPAGGLVEHDVLQNGTEADGIPDLWFARRRQPDRLGVAASLEIEDPLVRPAMLVVADEPAARVGGQRGLTGAG